MTDAYFCLDVETNGPLPGANAMLSVALVHVLPDGTSAGTFYARLRTPDGSSAHPNTIAWWNRTAASRQAFWALTDLHVCADGTSRAEPAHVMRRLRDWIADQCPADAKPVCVCKPSAFDATFLHWYFVRFAEQWADKDVNPMDLDPFQFRYLDISSYISGKLGMAYSDAVSRRGWPPAYRTKLESTHHAQDDALALADVWGRILRANAAEDEARAAKEIAAEPPPPSDTTESPQQDVDQRLFNLAKGQQGLYAEMDEIRDSINNTGLAIEHLCHHLEVRERLPGGFVIDELEKARQLVKRPE